MQLKFPRVGFFSLIDVDFCSTHTIYGFSVSVLSSVSDGPSIHVSYRFLVLCPLFRLKDNSGTASLLTRLPVKGIYKIEVTGHHNGRSNKLVSFLLICKSVLPDLKPFPSMPENGFGYDEVAKSVGLTEPSCSDGVVPVQQGQTADFHFHVQDDVDVRPRLKHAWRSPEDLDCHLEVRKTASELDVCVMLPEDDEYPEYSLEFTVNSRRAAGQSGNDDKNLDRFFSAVSYLLTYSKEVVEASKNEAKEVMAAIVVNFIFQIKSHTVSHYKHCTKINASLVDILLWQNHPGLLAE